MKRHREGGERDRTNAIVSYVETASSSRLQLVSSCRGTEENNTEGNTNKYIIGR